MTSRTVGCALVAVTAAAGVAVGGTGASAVPACRAMAISATAGTLTKLTVPSIHVSSGRCVEFANETATPVTVRIGTGYVQTIPAKGATSGSENYVAKASVTVKAAGGLRAGSGTITVVAPSPTPSHSPSPSPTPSRSHHPTPSPTPDVAPSPKHPHKSHHPHRIHVPAKISLPPLPPLPTQQAGALPRATSPVVAPGAPTAAPAPTNPTLAVQPAAATTIEPLGSNAKGLPAAVAIVLLLGAMAGFGRVALAAAGAVDSRPRRRRRP